MSSRTLAVSFTTLLVVGCATGGRGVVDMGGRPRDGGPSDGAHDAPTGDLGGPLDLGATDLGVADDLGAPDLGAPDLGAPDLGADAGPPDLGGVDMSAGCTSAAACSDGVACNGIERCVGGTCLPGTAVVCDDGIACTADTCSEPTGTCSFARDDTRCPPGSTCTASTASGCQSTSTCGESPCRLVTPQCGCPSGQACTISGTSRVCATPGTGTTGASCGAGTGCGTGTLCVTVTPTTNACERFCTSDSDCSGAGAICTLTLNDGTGGSIPGVTLCSLSCNPLSGTGCPSGATCRIFQEMSTARLLTHCGPVGTHTAGGSCTTDDDCVTGFACLDPTGTGTTTCNRWCNASTGTGCTGVTTCTGFTTPIIIGTTEYGVCV